MLEADKVEECAELKMPTVHISTVDDCDDDTGGSKHVVLKLQR